jgi:DNA-binding response OmpR family regulator
MMGGTKRKSILVADATQDVREILKEAIASLPLQTLVIEAEDGIRVQQKTQKQKFDLVIMDILLPRRDGIQLLEAFKNYPSEAQPLHILILTEKPYQDDWKKIFSNIDYLKRPCGMDEITSKLKAILLT